MSKLTLFLSMMWALSLLYGEWFAFLVPPLWTCSWPHLHRPSIPLLNGVDDPSNFVKVVVIADPQLMDRTSLHLAPKSLPLEIAQFYTDLNMRRAFILSMLPFNPDVILFLGDYFDGGDFLSDEDWQDSLSRFKHIFNLNLAQRTSNIKVYHLSGNHDVGYAAVNSQKPDFIQRYEREFGGRNFKVTLGKVDFIAIDAQTLDGHPQSDLTSATWNFIRNVSKDSNSTPSVLLTHIPLYRPDWSPCGPHRSSAIINQRMNRARHTQEILYQNYITKNSTDDLMDLIRPVLVLSGHDHDQCTVTHSSKNGPVSEHTLGTVSWQQGNLYPSFMLLSARNSTSNGTTPDDTVLTHICFLPMQTHIYIWYLSLFAITLVVAFLGPANEVLILHKLGALIGCLRNLFNFRSFVNSMKEKNEDDNCEYEEVWDAEGSMHLIKKTSMATMTKPSDERNSMERGNAVMRSVARKQTIPEIDVSIHVESDVKLPTRSNRSKGGMIIWRLLRTVRVLVIVAAINVPLYVLLVFKDWIDK